MKKNKLVTSLALVLVLTCCMMATSFAATTYQCNGDSGVETITASHSYGDGQNCDVKTRMSYCTEYVNGVKKGNRHHEHAHLTYHTKCPAGMTYPCAHNRVH